MTQLVRPATGRSAPRPQRIVRGPQIVKCVRARMRRTGMRRRGSRSPQMRPRVRMARRPGTPRCVVMARRLGMARCVRVSAGRRTGLLRQMVVRLRVVLRVRVTVVRAGSRSALVGRRVRLARRLGMAQRPGTARCARVARLMGIVRVVRGTVDGLGGGGVGGGGPLVGGLGGGGRGGGVRSRSGWGMLRWSRMRIRLRWLGRSCWTSWRGSRGLGLSWLMCWLSGRFRMRWPMRCWIGSRRSG